MGGRSRVAMRHGRAFAERALVAATCPSWINKPSTEMLATLTLSTIGLSWFDPLTRYKFPAERISLSATPPTICYVPGLDGTNGSPFVQWPPLSEAGYAIRVQDVRSDRPKETSFDASVDNVVDFLRGLGPTLLMGESYGAVVATAAALREPSLVTGLILVNPATAFSNRPQLQADAALLKTVPEPLFPAASFALLGRKTFDLNFLGTAFKDIVIDKSLEKLRESDPKLAGYYDGALSEMMAQVSVLPPRDFMVSRLDHLVDGCKLIEAGLTSLEPPLLVVAGTADALLDSEREAKRLQSILGPKRCKVHLVDGAGHAGTLDQRIELAGVIRRWTEEMGIAGELFA